MGVEELMLGNIVGVKGCDMDHAVVVGLNIEDRTADVVFPNGVRINIIEEDVVGVELEREYLLNHGFVEVDTVQGVPDEAFYKGEAVQTITVPIDPYYSRDKYQWFPKEKILKVGQRDFSCRYIHELQNITTIVNYGRI